MMPPVEEHLSYGVTSTENVLSLKGALATEKFSLIAC